MLPLTKGNSRMELRTATTCRAVSVEVGVETPLGSVQRFTTQLSRSVIVRSDGGADDGERMGRDSEARNLCATPEIVLKAKDDCDGLSAAGAAAFAGTWLKDGGGLLFTVRLNANFDFGVEEPMRL